MSFVLGEGSMHSQEEVQHALGPLLMLDLVEEREFAQQMGVAEAVETL